MMRCQGQDPSAEPGAGDRPARVSPHPVAFHLVSGRLLAALHRDTRECTIRAATIRDAASAAVDGHPTMRAVLRPASVPEPSESPAPEYPTIGETYSWDDGLAATVTTPQEFTPSEGNEIAGTTTYVRFTITLTNNAGAEFDSTLASESVQSGGREAEYLIDSANGFIGSPTVTVLPGRSVSYDVGYGVLDPAGLIVELGQASRARLCLAVNQVKPTSFRKRSANGQVRRLGCVRGRGRP